MQNGAKRNKNQNRPFFMYLSWRAPHRPMSHDWEYDPKNPWEHMPYVAQGKPGEQLGIFDEYIGTYIILLYYGKNSKTQYFHPFSVNIWDRKPKISSVI